MTIKGNNEAQRRRAKQQRGKDIGTGDRMGMSSRVQKCEAYGLSHIAI